jgi:nucleotide-binding universal stress UspA family protein
MSAIVVGVEGSTSSHDALVWAARTAADRGVDQIVVHAVSSPMSGYEITFDEVLEERGRDLLYAEVERAREILPGLAVRGELVRGTPGRVLTDWSTRADLLVVGSHHAGPVERLLAGSRSYQIVAGSHCPVVVAGPGSVDAMESGRGVVVGTDGSEEGRLAVQMAADEARRTGQSLELVHAWTRPGMLVPMGYLAGGFAEQVLEMAQKVVDDAVAGLSASHPDVVVHTHLVAESPAVALLDRARGAALLVVGSRGLNGVTRMLLGSVSHTVVQRAACPVLVVRGRHDPAAEPQV